MYNHIVDVLCSNPDNFPKIKSVMQKIGFKKIATVEQGVTGSITTSVPGSIDTKLYEKLEGLMEGLFIH